MATPSERDKLVREILAFASEPIGPTEIAFHIAEPWCQKNGDPKAAPIVPILRRIGAIRSGRGLYGLSKNM